MRQRGCGRDVSGCRLDDSDEPLRVTRADVHVNKHGIYNGLGAKNRNVTLPLGKKDEYEI